MVFCHQLDLPRFTLCSPGSAWSSRFYACYSLLCSVLLALPQVLWALCLVFLVLSSVLSTRLRVLPALSSICQRYSPGFSLRSATGPRRSGWNLPVLALILLRRQTLSRVLWAPPLVLTDGNSRFLRLCPSSQAQHRFLLALSWVLSALLRDLPALPRSSQPSLGSPALPGSWGTGCGVGIEFPQRLCFLC